MLFVGKCVGSCFLMCLFLLPCWTWFRNGKKNRRKSKGKKGKDSKKRKKKDKKRKGSKGQLTDQVENMHTIS